MDFCSITLIAITLYLLYRFNDTMNENVQILMMNTREITRFEVQGNELLMEGLINSKTYEQFIHIMKEFPEIKTIVETNMEGSIDDEYIRCFGV